MWPILVSSLINIDSLEHFKKRTYEPTEKLALQIRSWQINANLFKVMRNSLLRDFYLVSLFFVAP